jgi:alpha-glucosidase
VNLGDGAELGRVETYRVDQRYPWRGVHSEAVNRANGARVSVVHAASKTPYTIDLRVSDDAAAVRFVVPGRGVRVPDAAMAFRIPAGSTVWSHGLRDHYEAVCARRAIEEIPDGD